MKAKTPEAIQAFAAAGWTEIKRVNRSVVKARKGRLNGQLIWLWSDREWSAHVYQPFGCIVNAQSGETAAEALGNVVAAAERVLRDLLADLGTVPCEECVRLAAHLSEMEVKRDVAAELRAEGLRA